MTRARVDPGALGGLFHAHAMRIITIGRRFLHNRSGPTCTIAPYIRLSGKDLPPIGTQMTVTIHNNSITLTPIAHESPDLPWREEERTASFREAFGTPGAIGQCELQFPSEQGSGLHPATVRA